METVDLDQAKARLSELVHHAIKGEEVVITENDQPVVPLAPATRRPKFGSAKGLIAIGEDFDAPHARCDCQQTGDEHPSAGNLLQQLGGLIFTEYGHLLP